MIAWAVGPFFACIQPGSPVLLHRFMPPIAVLPLYALFLCSKHAELGYLIARRGCGSFGFPRKNRRKRRARTKRVCGLWLLGNIVCLGHHYPAGSHSRLTSAIMLTSKTLQPVGLGVFMEV